MKREVSSELTAWLAFLSAFVGDHYEPKTGGYIAKARNAGTVISVVVIGVVALVGILIFGQVYDAMDMDSEIFGDGGALEGTPDSILDGFGAAMEFVPIILLVLLASVVIAVVQRMRT